VLILKINNTFNWLNCCSFRGCFIGQGSTIAEALLPLSHCLYLFILIILLHFNKSMAVPDSPPPPDSRLGGGAPLFSRSSPLTNEIEKKGKRKTAEYTAAWELPDPIGCEEVHHRLIARLQGRRLGYVHEPAPSRFPARLLSKVLAALCSTSCGGYPYALETNVCINVLTMWSMSFAALIRKSFRSPATELGIPLPVTGFGPTDGPAFKIHITQPQSSQMPPE